MEKEKIIMNPSLSQCRIFSPNSRYRLIREREVVGNKPDLPFVVMRVFRRAKGR